MDSFLTTGGGGGGAGGGGGGGGPLGDGNFGAPVVAVVGANSIASLLSKVSPSVLKSIMVACINNPIGLKTAHFPNSNI